MESKTEKRNEVANLIIKIDKKTKELKLLKKTLQNAFNDIVDTWKKESAMQFPQLKPCDIDEYVGVDVTIKGKVYNILISEYRQKLFCMFCFDRKNKKNSRLTLKETMDQHDFDKLSRVVNDYLSLNKKKICSTSVGYYVNFKKEQYDEAFQFYLEIVKTFIECQEKKY